MKRQKWEYLTCFLGVYRQEKHKEYLNTFGDDGWELVSINEGIAYFKRPVVEEQPDTAFPSDMDAGFVTIFTPGE